MFEGTDLSYAYGEPQGHPYADNHARPASQPLTPPPPPALTSSPQPPAAASTSHALPPDVQYNPPAAMYAAQPSGVTHDGLFERMARKKGEVLKLVTLSLVILLGLALDRFLKHYANNYITSAFLSDFQELLVRLAYPAAVVCVIWVLRASA